MLTRTREEALAIVSEAFSVVHLRSDQLEQLIVAYSRYSDFHCDNCHKTGNIITLWALTNSTNELRTEVCHCAEFKRVNDALKSRIEQSGIPEKYQTASTEKWQSTAKTQVEETLNRASLLIINSYVEKLDRMRKLGYGLFLCGPNGVGKTYLACAIAIKAVTASYDVKYYTMPKIVRTVIDGWYDDAKGEIIRDIEESDFLVIDDLDKSYKTKTQIEISVLDNLFRERLQNNRPMIVTSNRTLSQVEESHGSSIHSMFREHCADCVILGTDYRDGIADRMVKDILS